MINNLLELFQEICSTSETDVPEAGMKGRMEKSVFKRTICGAWISYDDTGVEVGSIVEGVDDVTNYYELTYPFDKKDFWGKLEEVEKDANEIWNNTHGCSSCYSDFPDSNEVDPECTGCNGNGIA